MIRHFAESVTGSERVYLANEVDAEIAARNKALSPIACWWAMVEAQAKLSEDGPIPQDAVILHFMGSGASMQVTAQQLRDALLPDNR